MSVMNKEELSKLILENQKEMYVLAYSILQNQADEMCIRDRSPCCPRYLYFCVGGSIWNRELQQSVAASRERIEKMKQKRWVRIDACLLYTSRCV